MTQEFNQYAINKNQYIQQRIGVVVHYNPLLSLLRRIIYLHTAVAWRLLVITLSQGSICGYLHSKAETHLSVTTSIKSTWEAHQSTGGYE